LNFREACLLDASGELTPAAREELLQYLRENPAAASEYHEILETFEAARPAPQEFSARQRFEFPVQIKAAIAGELLRQKQAGTRARLIRYAWRGVFATAAMLALVALVWPAAQARAHDRAQFAAINRAVDTLAAVGDLPGDARRSEVEASIRQLETESPTLSHVYDKNLANLLEALAAMPVPEESSEDWAPSESF